MATQTQLRRGTAAQNNSFTGAVGELSYDTENKSIRVHDGSTAGGIEVLTGNGDISAKTSDGAALTLETSDTTVTDGSVLGKIEFKAPDEASGTDAILVGAAIEAVAEGTFAADNNATELVFKTGASAAADVKMTLTSGGNLIIPAGVTLGTSAGTYVAANTLDDYEEGTHQTAVTMSTSGTVTLNTSYDRFSYTKIGRLVTITGHPRIASVSSPVGSISLTLPFTAASGQVDECRTGGVMRYYDNSAGSGSYNRPVAWSIQEASSTLSVDNINTNGNNFTPAESDEFYFSISYITA